MPETWVALIYVFLIFAFQSRINSFLESADEEIEDICEEAEIHLVSLISFMENPQATPVAVSEAKTEPPTPETAAAAEATPKTKKKLDRFELQNVGIISRSFLPPN